MPVKLADSVAAQLEQLIVKGDYRLGEKLPPERVLAERFGVGRSSMREALRTLEARGLLRTTHGVGVFVIGDKRAQFDSQFLGVEGHSLAELMELRLAVEPYSADLAAKRITDREATELLKLLEDSSRPNLSDQEFIEYDARIHRAICAAGKNRLLDAIQDSIRPLFLSYSIRVIGLPDRRRLATESHRHIVEGVVRRHPRDASREAQRHITDVEQAVIRSLTR